MNASLLLILQVLLPFAIAHTRFTTLFVNDESQGDGTCIRMDMDGSRTTDYIGFEDASSTPGSQHALSSADMVCGVGGAIAVGRTCALNAGDKIGLLHRLWSDGSQPGAIDPSHNGSTAVYMKKMADASSSEPWTDDAAGDGWFKISWSGYDEDSGLWGTGMMNENNGLVETNVPSDLESGYYLIRSEVLALQNVIDEEVNPQFYAGCAQVYVASTGTAQPATVAIPGYIDESASALAYNIYKWIPPQRPFEEFGPAAYGSEAGPAIDLVKIADSSQAVNTASASVIGTCPTDTILEVANECLTEIPSWFDDTRGALPKCWAASQACWDQLDTCWNNVSPAINGADKSVGCNLWEDKCASIVEWCEAGTNLQGPPNAGQALLG